MENIREIEVLKQVLLEVLDFAAAQELLQISRSTLYRKIKKLREQGVDSLEHGLLGRPSNARIRSQTRDRIIQIYQEHAGKFTSTHQFYRACKNLFPEPICFATLLSWVENKRPAPERREALTVAGQMVLTLALPNTSGLVSIDVATQTALVLSEATDTPSLGIMDHVHRLFQQHGICETLILAGTIYLNEDTHHRLFTLATRLGTALLFEKRSTPVHPFLKFWREHHDGSKTRDEILHAYNKQYAQRFDPQQSLFVPLNNVDPKTLLEQ